MILRELGIIIWLYSSNCAIFFAENVLHNICLLYTRDMYPSRDTYEMIKIYTLFSKIYYRVFSK